MSFSHRVPLDLGAYLQVFICAIRPAVDSCGQPLLDPRTFGEHSLKKDEQCGFRSKDVLAEAFVKCENIDGLALLLFLGCCGVSFPVGVES